MNKDQDTFTTKVAVSTMTAYDQCSDTVKDRMKTYKAYSGIQKASGSAQLYMSILKSLNI